MFLLMFTANYNISFHKDCIQLYLKRIIWLYLLKGEVMRKFYPRCFLHIFVNFIERMRERAREREREKAREREREGARERERDRETDRDWERQRDRETERDRERQREKFLHSFVALWSIYTELKFWIRHKWRHPRECT